MQLQKNNLSEFATALHVMGPVKRVALSRLVVVHDAQTAPIADCLARTARDKRWSLRPSPESARLLRALASARPPCVVVDAGTDVVRVLFNGEMVRILQAHVPAADWPSVRIACLILDGELATQPVPPELIGEAITLLAAAMPEPKARDARRLLRQQLGVLVTEDDRDIVRALSADQNATRRSR